MIITNSLGSNYTAGDRSLALKLLFQPWKWQNGLEIEQLKDAILDILTFGRIASFQVRLFLKGRHAIYEALRRLGIGQGDEVIVQAFTCVAVIRPILDLGATPIYVDVKSKTLNPSFDQIKKTVTPKTKAIILQHTLGYINRGNDRITDWCRNRKIFVIQDLAHSLSLTPKLITNNQQLTPSADAIILSFSQDKVIDGVSGGALVIARRPDSESGRRGNLSESIIDRHAPISPGLAMTDIIKLLLYPVITYLIRLTYPIFIGKLIHFCAKNLNLLPSPLEAPSKPTQLPNALATIALNQLDRLEQIIVHRRHIALIYDRIINKKFKLIMSIDIKNGSCLRYPLWVENRDELENKLTKHGFYLMDHWYDAPVSPEWVDNSEVKYYPGSCPNAENLSKHIFNLPTHINITEEKAERLAKLINSYQNTSKGQAFLKRPGLFIIV